MANTNNVLSIVLGLVSLFVIVPPPSCHAQGLKACNFDAIYQLGDSISDTGNLIREKPDLPYSRLPFGQNFYKNATGRCSNGLLMIDYFALSAGLPFLEAYLNGNKSSTHGGVNFAVAGCTALPVEALAQKNISSPLTSSSLSKQLDWMFTYFKGICNNDKDCSEKVKRSLFMVGEIGGNDLNYALLQGKTLADAKAMVPDIVQAIKDAAKRVINYGARRLVIPGNFPIGCFPIYLTRFPSNDSSAYDEFNCLKSFNELSMYQNERLQQAIQELSVNHPDVAIAYGDYYNAFMWIQRYADLLGFDVRTTQKSCCGAGGKYNFSLDPKRKCGAADIPVCRNPNTRISWDGVHPTQRAYEYMSKWLISKILPKLRCN